MKPSLLYIKRYIQQQSTGCLIRKANTDSNKNNFNFNPTHLNKNKNFKQMYFTMPKSFSQFKERIKKPIISQIKVQVIQSLQIENQNQDTQSQAIVGKSSVQQRKQIQITFQRQSLCLGKKQVKWNIQSDIITQQQMPMSQGGNSIQLLHQKSSSHAISPLQSINKIPKKLMNLGYSNIESYIQQMNKTNKIKTPKRSMAVYHYQNNKQIQQKQLNSYNKKIDNQKKQISQKNKFYKENVEIRPNFNSKYVKQIKQRTKNSLSSTFKKSKFNSNLKNQEQNCNNNSQMNQKSKILNNQIYDYESIIVVGCSNSNYFNINIQSNTSIQQLFRHAVPLLNNKLDQIDGNIKNINQNQRNQSKKSHQNQLYFCLLINYQCCLLQSFFFVGTPTLFYKKQALIQNIGTFLKDFKVAQLFPSQKIYIVDFKQQKTSYVSKSRFNLQQNNDQKGNTARLKKNNNFRKSSRLSRSIQYLHQSSNPLILSLLASFQQNNSINPKIKVEKKAINTKGSFNFNSRQLQI